MDGYLTCRENRGTRQDLKRLPPLGEAQGQAALDEMGGRFENLPHRPPVHRLTPNLVGNRGSISFKDFGVDA